MRVVGAIYFALFWLLGLLNGIVFVGTVVTLLKQWVGLAAYVLWIVVAPIISPAIFGLPWFEAWVTGEPVSERFFWIWLCWVACFTLHFILIASVEVYNKIRTSRNGN